MNSAQLNLMAGALLPALPASVSPPLPPYTANPDVAALLKRLIESEDDQETAQSAAAWRASKATPLRHQALVHRTKGWRTRRGLNADAAFGASESKNFLLLANATDPMSRADFYPLALDSFGQAVKKKAPGTDPIKWKALAGAFMKDDTPNSGWPAVNDQGSDANGLKASQFAQQLLRDCLTAEIGMLDGPPAEDPPLLKALGEHRRSGNHYTREDAELRRNELIKELQKTPGA